MKNLKRKYIAIFLTIAIIVTSYGSAGFADRALTCLLPLYSKGTDYTRVMWCSTCHDVNNPDKGTPFLNTSNAGSAMCLTCHNK